MSDFWWKNAVIYGIDIGRFCDGNGDGIGDFEGLISKLPYLSELGVTCIWLLPFFPSSGRDNGYDITDYFQVDPKLGTLHDLIEFMHKAGEHSIRIILDLVAQHTSDQHPWFQAARANEKSRYRNYYIWAQHPPPVKPGKGPIFPGEEESVWTYDEVARAHYHHRFYHFEPELNTDNPDVRHEIERIIDYWTSFGISGFRLDAASHMVERDIEGIEGPADRHDILREIFSSVKEKKPDAMILGEVDEDPERLTAYFDGEQLTMMLNFFLQNYLTLALAVENSRPLEKGLRNLPNPPENGQWANFLRNLDEADLERLAPEEFEAAFAAFAPEEDMRIYGRGIRRRLAPMLGGDARRLKLAFSLLFSLPGAPLFVYGDEIGMGDDLTQHGRSAVRSPMQWTAGRNAGFSSAAKEELIQPVLTSGDFSCKRINVEEQREREDSILNFVRRLIEIRRAHPELAGPSAEVLATGCEQAFAQQYASDRGKLLILHNLSGKRRKLDLRLDPAVVHDFAPLIGGPVPVVEDGHLSLELAPYETRWLKHEEG